VHVVITCKRHVQASQALCAGVTCRICIQISHALPQPFSFAYFSHSLSIPKERQALLVDDAAAHRKRPTRASLREQAATGGSLTGVAPGRFTADQLRVALGGTALNPPVPALNVDADVLRLLVRFHALPVAEQVGGDSTMRGDSDGKPPAENAAGAPK